jgi:hypothetical protein
MIRVGEMLEGKDRTRPVARSTTQNDPTQGPAEARPQSGAAQRGMRRAARWRPGVGRALAAVRRIDGRDPSAADVREPARVRTLGRLRPCRGAGGVNRRRYLTV